MKSESCIILSNLPDLGCHHRIPYLTLQDHFYTDTRSCSVSGGLVNKWCSMSWYQWAKPSQQTCNHCSWNVCNRHWSRRSQHWFIAKVYCSSMTMSGLMWCRWPQIPYTNLTGRHCTYHHTPHTLLQQITTSSIPWTTIFVRYLQTCIPDTWFLLPGHCAAGGVFIKSAGCSWGLLWGLMYTVYLLFLINKNCKDFFCYLVYIMLNNFSFI